ncbi:MAG: penicillin-binding protein 2 [Limisphaera sp.]|nr:penicillin-binding protein 2 [Limisphaera sp.]
MGDSVKTAVQLRRAVLVATVLFGLFGLLAYRLVELQLVRHPELAEEARRNREREFLRQPRRGDILDARGVLLATSVPVRTVCADPVLVGDRQAVVARLLSPLLGISELELQQKLLPRVRWDAETGRAVTNRYVVLARKVPVETWQQIRKAMATLAPPPDSTLPRAEQRFLSQLSRYAVFVEPWEDQMRVYPNQKLAAHVLGYTGLQEVTVDGVKLLETRGADGLERTLDAQLAGVRGWRVTEVDGGRREVVRLRDQDVEPRDGWNVVVTLDAVIQNILESALAEAMEQHRPRNITGIVLRPQTGAILAMACLPNFDPNRPGDAPEEARRNVILTDHMEPGSTFKIVVVAGALNDGVVRLEDVFDCEQGRFAYGGRILHDHHPYDLLTVEEIITKSSNIGAAKIGMRLGEPRLYEYIRAFGFGARTGLPLLGEMPGYVPPVNRWYKISIAQIPMGHGVAVTRMQMAMAMAALANGGVLMRPMLVERLEDRRGRVVAAYEPQVVRRVVGEEAARAMVRALKTVPTPQGTAPAAAVPGYAVAGKTGTAQKAEGTRGYVPGKYISSFIGFLPADRPEVLIAITLDEPQRGYYGGQVAGPVFRKVAERVMQYLGVPPDDLETESGSVARAASEGAGSRSGSERRLRSTHGGRES